MKKIIIAALLGGVLAGGAFAQITFSGSVYAGIQLQNGGDADEAVTATHREEGEPMFNFIGTVTRENFGARLDTTFQMADDPDRHFTLNGIYGWVDFGGLWGNDSLRLVMGQISSTPWVLNTWHNSHAEVKLGEVRGFRVEYSTPVQGLSVGAAFRADGHDLRRSGERMVFGATYIHPVFSAVFSYDITANGQALFGFNFTGIPDVTAGFQLRAERLASWDGDSGQNHGALRLRQMLGYRVMRDLNVFLISTQDVSRAPDSDTALEFIPGVEYRILPNLTASFSVILQSPDQFTTTNLTLNPLLEYTLTGPAMLYVEYELRLDNMDRAAHTVGFGITIRAF
ncbi:MAG: hypothetical protein FWC64_05770 [Treponema sp.]|nr:hypothetical protein [Treponema sp.]